MCGERKVVQQKLRNTTPHLEFQGVANLVERVTLSKTQKVKVWDILLNKDLFIIAYESIKGNIPADNDGFSMEIIDKTIRSLKDHTFQFKPVRRIFITKKDGNRRPIGIAGPIDKIVQKAMAIILEALYADLFLESNHAFRRGFSTHTALKAITS
jgi:retron-type reverse transcriptase